MSEKSFSDFRVLLNIVKVDGISTARLWGVCSKTIRTNSDLSLASCHFSEVSALGDRDGVWEGIEVTESSISILYLGELICLCSTALNLNLVVFLLHYFTSLLHSFALSLIIYK